MTAHDGNGRNRTVIMLLTVVIDREDDIVLARRRARDVGRFLGFSAGDTTRITTALSEIARNALEYAGGGRATFALQSHGEGVQELMIAVADRGPGIADPDIVLSPDFVSRTGMGVGIRGSRALMDRFSITPTPHGGTTVTMAKRLPRQRERRGLADVAQLAEALAKSAETTPIGELQFQNQSLLHALRELGERQAQVEELSVIATLARERADAALLVAERSLVVRERFMALTTHELRTPLNAIMGYQQLLELELDGTMTAKQKDYFARTQRAARHLLGITNDFLDMAKGDSGRLTVERHQGAARQVMSEAAALVAPQAADRGVAVELSETSEHVMYSGDVHRIRQVLVNLLGNAVSFTPRGGTVIVTAEMSQTPPADCALAGRAGPWCTIRVEDTGPGIPQEKLGHVFEPFVQLSSNGNAARKGGGSGLGLTVSRQLAQLMGGDLTAASTGTGATFTLWLSDGFARHPMAVAS